LSDFFYIKRLNIKILKITDNILLNKNYFDKMNDSFNEIQLLNNNIFNELVSIDEFSIGNNRTTKKGWSKSGKECMINLPYFKQNKIYSLLMTTTKSKIIKYLLVEGNIKTDNFISFMNDLKKLK
jgi:hypothetical protein